MYPNIVTSKDDADKQFPRPSDLADSIGKTKFEKLSKLCPQWYDVITSAKSWDEVCRPNNPELNTSNTIFDIAGELNGFSDSYCSVGCEDYSEVMTSASRSIYCAICDLSGAEYDFKGRREIAYNRLVKGLVTLIDHVEGKN